jgi:hypothetical protein
LRLKAQLALVFREHDFYHLFFIENHVLLHPVLLKAMKTEKYKNCLRK